MQSLPHSYLSKKKKKKVINGLGVGMGMFVVFEETKSSVY
jgi:hypothetical protein